MIWAHLQGVDSSRSLTGRSTVRGACQQDNSHHRRNYIHKHSLLSCRVPFDLLLTLIWAFWNICGRSLHCSISLRSHNQIRGRSPVSHYLPKTKIYYRQTAETDTVLFYSGAVQTGPGQGEWDPGVEMRLFTMGLALLHVRGNRNYKHYTYPARLSSARRSSCKRDSSDYLKCGSMRYLSTVSALPTIDGGRNTPSQQENTF